jgi:hypothetical protein
MENGDWGWKIMGPGEVKIRKIPERTIALLAALHSFFVAFHPPFHQPHLLQHPCIAIVRCDRITTTTTTTTTASSTVVTVIITLTTAL